MKTMAKAALICLMTLSLTSISLATPMSEPTEDGIYNSSELDNDTMQEQTEPDDYTVNDENDGDMASVDDSQDTDESDYNEFD